MRKFLIYILTLFGILSAAMPAESQDLDSLWDVFNTVKDDTSKIILLNEEIGLYYESVNPDSAILMYDLAADIADKHIYNPGKISKKHLFYFQFYKFTALRYAGMLYANFSEHTMAQKYFNNALSMTKMMYESGSSEKEKRILKGGLAACYVNIGITYYYTGVYEAAVSNYLKSLKLYEELISTCTNKSNRSKYKYGISTCYTNLGNIYQEQMSTEKALDYHFKSLKIKKEIDDERGEGICLNNIGNTFLSKFNYKKAEEYYKKALDLAIKTNDTKSQSISYSNLGIVEKRLGNYDGAIEFYTTALKIKLELDDKNGITNVYSNIASLYISKADSIAKTESEKNMYISHALQYAEKALIIAREIKALPYVNEAYKNLMLVNKLRKNFKMAYLYADDYIVTKDSLFSDEKTVALNEMGAKYEAEKKQLRIDRLNNENKIKQVQIDKNKEEAQKQQLVINAIVIGLSVFLVFLLLVILLFMQKKKANKLLNFQKLEIQQKNDDLQQANHEVLAQKEEIEVQRDLVVEQKDRIEEQKNLITTGIELAKNIQQSLLPQDEHAQNIFGDHFIIFKPKDIVSGDFYWGTKIDDLLIVTVADCTGHGVPGAFMSMMGISFLNEIVSKKKIFSAGEILDDLRASVISALKQKGFTGEQKDGMDMSLCVINTSNGNMQFAGAYNPCIIMKKSGEMIDLLPDKQPVAIYDRMKPFTNTECTLEKGDRIYLFSDGYVDQFGGPKGKKFRIAGLKELLIRTAGLPLDQQKVIIQENLDQWMTSHDKIYDQIDDITVLGLVL